MIKLLLTATALATFTPIEPVIEFTSDSVYKYDDILEINLKESETFEETFLVHLEFKEINRTGYKIYDNPDTSYIDGLQWDHAWVENWKVENIDFSIPHTLTIKTVYTDDYAGMVMAAKDGDWSLLLKNPETVLKLVYYGLSVLSIIVSAFILMFSKKRKVKSSDEISNKVTLASASLKNSIQLEVQNALKSIISPVIKSLVLSKSDKPEDIVAMLDLLESTDSKEDIKELSTNIKSKINETVESKKAEIEHVREDLHKIINENVDDAIDELKL